MKKRIVKKLLTCLLMLGASCIAVGQNEPQKAGYLRFPTVPPFSLLNPDSTFFSREDLPKQKKLLIMYFSPECDHCRQQTTSMLQHMEDFKDVQIVMATNRSYRDMVGFNKEFNLAKYSNIRIGCDTKFFFPPFYKMASLPFLVLYSKKGKLITTFQGTTQIERVSQAFASSGS